MTAPTARTRVIHLLDLEPARPLPDSEHDAFRRRYSVLFSEEGTGRRGGLGMVSRVANAYGEKLALKTLLPSEPEGARQPAAGQGPDGTAVDGRRQDALLSAFRAEYESQRALQGIGCVPTLYGWGVVDGRPAILMEWVEGETLERARTAMAVDDAGRLSPPVAAALGRDLFAALAELAAADGPVVHRDVSPANVMVRTSVRSLEEQVADEAFDLCLIDFGSSVAGETRLGSLTRAGVARRWATPDYAPPEMLTDDIAGVAELRRSPAIDVYAAASVVYELACGTPPYGRGDAPLAAGLSPYRLKMDCAPATPVFAHADASTLDAVLLREPEVAEAVAGAIAELPAALGSEECSRDLGLVDAQIGEALLACLTAEQEERPGAAEVSHRFGVIAARYAVNVGHALRGEALEPRDAAFAGAAPLRARRAARVVAHAACAAMTLATCGACAAQTGSIAVAALALPLAAGMALRARGRGTVAGIVRGAVGIAVGAAGACAALSWAAPAGPALADFVPALLAVCAGAWLPIAVDYATLSETSGKEGA